MPIIGESDGQAKEQLARLQSWLTSTNAMALVSQPLGHDISGYPLDGPVPDFPQKTERGQTFSNTLLEMARREKMTLRDLYNLTAAARGHWVFCGTPKTIADTLEEWFTGGTADGFIIMPAYFPGAFDDFVDLVVPELQRRGLFRKDYGARHCATISVCRAQSARRRDNERDMGIFGIALHPHRHRAGSPNRANRRAVIFAFALAALLPATAWAQSFPNKPIKLIL